MTREIQIYNKNKAIDIKRAAWNILSENSRQSYGKDYELFFSFIKKNPKNISPDDILQFINYLVAEGYKNSSINRKVASLSKFFKVMLATGEIISNPVDTLKQFKNINFKVDKHVKTQVTMKEIKKAIDMAKKEDMKTVIIIRTLAKTGLRISELINMKYSDITEYDKINFSVRVVGKGKKERTVFIKQWYLAEIQEIFPKRHKTPFVFYNYKYKALDRKVLYKYIKHYFKKTIGKDVHPHMLRHSFAIHKIMVEKKDIKATSKYLGHEDVSTTLNIYVNQPLSVKDSEINI